MAQTTIDFNDYASGTIVSDNYSSLGVHISSVARVDRGGNGDAMIFDTANVTGRDFDLAYDDQGGALIISEDGDSMDADDDRAGGTITFDFDAPSALTSLTVLDAEEGGLIEIYDDTGAKIGEVEIPPGSNNDSRVIDLPFEGVSKMEVTLNGSGAIDDLVFDPGVTMEPDDEITAEIQGTTADGSEVTFEIELPKDFDGTTSYLSASLLVGSGGDQTNVAFVVDVSGSTSDPFLGTAVGDVNYDFLSDTILDAEIASLLNLSSAIAGIGLQPDEIDVGLITFESGSSFEGEFEPGSTGLSAALTSLSVGGNTNYAAGLQSTIDFFAANNAAGENNVVYFLSDGYPNVGGSFADEVQTLEDVYNAQIVAVGIGNGAALNELNEIDNTGGAEIVTSTDELDATLVDASMVGGAALEDFFVFVNGVEQTDIDETDLVASVFGYRLPLTEIDNLDPTAGVENSVVAQIILDDGTEFELTATLEGGGYLIEGELL